MIRSVGLRSGGSFAPPPAPEGFRLYRLRFLGNNGRNTLNVAEVELRAVPGGPNVAFGGLAFASSVFEMVDAPAIFPAVNAFDANPNTFWSSSYVGGRREAGDTGVPAAAGAYASSEFGTDFRAENAFDSKPATFWSATGATGWLAYAYQIPGSSVIVPSVNPSKYAVRARHDAANGAPKDWTLEYSDDNAAWTVAHATTSQTSWANGERREFSFASVGSHSYWRLNVTANNGRATLNIAELEFIGYTWGTITLGYDLGAWNDKDVTQYSIQARSDAANGAPKDWVLESSIDGAIWTTLHTVTGETAWTNGETRVFTV